MSRFRLPQLRPEQRAALVREHDRKVEALLRELSGTGQTPVPNDVGTPDVVPTDNEGNNDEH